MNDNSRSSGLVAKVEESGVLQALGPRDVDLTSSVGKYRFLGVLGHGGMADVYLAMAEGSQGFRKLCVVKMLKEAMAADEDFRAMFIDEARLAARLTHPNIVQTYEVEAVGGHLLLAMEYVEGATLGRVRRRMNDDAFPLEAAVRVLCDVLDALSYAHSAQDFDGQSLDIVHRDVSPHNIIVGYSGNVKLVDFGIAKSTASIQATQAGVLKGKIGYMAPEQASFGEVDQRADLFSVGVILWETIAGRRLIEGMSSHASLLRRVEGGEPRIEDTVPDVDPQLATIVGRALAPQSERYATANEFQADLEAWLTTRTEMPRRTWAANVAAAFEEDRRKLQSVANSRQHSEASLSNIRLPPPSNPGEAPLPPTAPPPAMVQSGLPQPLPSRSGMRPVLIMGGLVVIAAVVGVVAYLASSATTRAPVVTTSSTSASSTAAVAATAPTAAISISPPATGIAPGSESTPPVAASSLPTPAVDLRPILRHGNAPIVAPPPRPPEPARGAARPGPTSPETPRPTASGARPLDERDPYAP